MERMRLLEGDAIEIMPTLMAGCVDMVLCDLPYGTTQNKWDSVIPFDFLWAQYKRLCCGVVALTATQPFSSALVMSNLSQFKYEWVWEKSNATGHLNANRAPMRKHEVVLIFGAGQYNAQKIEKPKSLRRPPTRGRQAESYGSSNAEAMRTAPSDVSFPQSILKIANGSTGGDKGLHPTQKPVALMEYLIRTYTDIGDTVLDNCMGSGTTGVACVNTLRNFIGIEKDEKYFALAKQRIEDRRRLLKEFLS